MIHKKHWGEESGRPTMSQPKQPEDACTSRDYWNLPEGVRAELIDGKLYDMAPPSWVHQVIVTGLSRAIGNHIEKTGAAAAW